MRQLRPYQELAVTRAVEMIRRKDRPIVASPTGSGKTTIGVEIIRRLERPTLWVAHRSELITQARDRLIAEGIRPRTICASVPDIPPPHSDVWVASVQTLRHRGIPDGVSLVAIDECHHAVSKLYEPLKSLDGFGLSATPFRLDGKPLAGAGFTDIIATATARMLIADGFMMSPEYYGPPGPVLSDTRLRGGDFKADVMFDAMARPTLIGDVVEHWQRLAQGRPTVCYAVNVRHAELLSDAFNGSGARFVSLDGSTAHSRRADILRALADGDIDGVTNCMVLTEGWDMPSLSCAIIARPTASKSLHLQMLGRIVRPHPGKPTPIVLDHAGNVERHGFVDDHLGYSLHHDMTRPTMALGVWRCKACLMLVAAGITTCPHCGSARVRDVAARGVPDVSAGELARIERSRAKREADFFEALVAESWRLHGCIDPVWITGAYRAEFDCLPMFFTDGPDLVFVPKTNCPPAIKRSWYLYLRRKAKAMGYKPGWADHSFKSHLGHWPANKRVPT